MRHTDQPHRYEIRLRGHLDPRWAARFDGMTLTTGDGTTLIQGPVTDQAALHGLLRTVYDIGLPLLAVSQIDVNEIDVNEIDASQIDASQIHNANQIDTSED